MRPALNGEASRLVIGAPPVHRFVGMNLNTPPPMMPAPGRDSSVMYSTPFGRIARPSQESVPTFGRKRTCAGSEVVVSAPLPDTVTPVVVSGSRISNRRPPPPVSSPTTIVPQGVLRTGSQVD